MIKGGIDNNLLKSLSYILVSGASKGLNYIILLFLAVGSYSEQYVAILLLFSLEQILSLLLPLNQSSLIYSKSILSYKQITNKLISSSVIVSVTCVLVFFALKKYIFSYFDVHKAIIFFSLFLSMTINAYLNYLTNYYKMIEEHGKALLIQGLLMISFGSILIHILIVEDKVVAFFWGKALGLLLVLTLVKFLGLTKFKFKIVFLSLSELKLVLNLFSVSALGWGSGLGFMNLAKMYSTAEELVEVGYILNIFNVFLLVSIGVNSVYGPLIKKHVIKNEREKVIKIKNQTLMIYLLIVLLVIVLYILVINLGFQFNHKIEQVLSILPFAILLFVFNIFHWISQPFYMVNNKFNSYNYLNILSYVFWVLTMIVGLYYGYSDFIAFLMLIHFMKGAMTYLYAKRKLMTINMK
ncbi:hypothetical protein GSB9_02162 [Flavobacteriaceae bacterium GSB9]|nr:hypothetical protein GSB9_02162 [Flavobacteriaceae bacterium GSB9]